MWSDFFLYGMVLVHSLSHAVSDLHETVARIFREGDTKNIDPTQLVHDVSPGDVTDDQDQFCSVAFENATGVTPEQFVLRYVESNGGRVWQNAIVACLPWSKPKVSRLLSKLELRDELERELVGRKKLVRVPDGPPAPESGGPTTPGADGASEPSGP